VTPLPVSTPMPAGLTALPKATALTTYSYRVQHSRQAAFLNKAAPGSAAMS
jgi:hypothetical protein